MRLSLKYTLLAAFTGALTVWAVYAQIGTAYQEYQIRNVTTMTAESRDPAQPAITISRVFFGRADGSKGARTLEVLGGKPCTSTTYWDTKRQIEVTASDCLKMKTSIPYPHLPMLPAKPLPTCAYFIQNKPAVGNEVIFGLKVERFENDTPSARSVEYFAPDLGCLQVRSAYYWKDTKGRITGTTVTEPLEIKLGYHDALLFETPSDYVEVRPSDRRNSLHQYFSGKNEVAACLRLGNERQDRRYDEARAGNDHHIEGRGVLALLRKFRSASAMPMPKPDELTGR